MFENFGCDLELTQRGLAFILPTYDAFDYARIAAQTFFEHTPLSLQPFCILLDDASPSYEQQDWEAWYDGLPRERCCHYHYPVNGGLTRSWNDGLQLARRYFSRYAITGNSDIRFTPNWHIGLRYHLRKAQLVGPVSNAPGRTHHNDQRQNVRNWFPGYELTDDPEQLLRVANYLHSRHYNSFIERDINGFFMMAETETWMAGRFDDQHVFDPRNKMVGNEDELVKRWRKTLGFKVGFVPSSFIFHYRSVSRTVRGVDVGRYRLKQEQ